MTNHTPIDDLVQQHHQAQTPQSAPPTFKESEPFPPHKRDIEIDEHVEHEVVPEEVKPHIEVRPETVVVPETAQQLGVQATPSASSFTTQQSVKVPLSDDKIVVGLKAPVTDSFRWLAELAVFILAQAHLQLKEVGGKITRVLKK